MDLGMSASTIRMPFLSKNFNFLKNKVSIKREDQKKFFQRYFPLPFQITTTNNKDKRIGIVQSVLSVLVTSVFSIFWMADVSSIVLFPIYLRYHPDGLGGSAKPAHHKLLLPTPKIAKYNLMLILILKHQLTELCISNEALLSQFTSLCTSATWLASD